MAQSQNGDDKDFVLSSDFRGRDELEPREDVYYRNGKSNPDGRLFKHIYIAIAGFLILMVLSIVVIARTYRLAEKSQLLALESRLEQLEGRLGSLEGQGGLSPTGGSGSPLILLTERLDQLEANVTARMNNIANQLNPKPLTSAAQKAPQAAAAKAASAAKKETRARIHIVKKGETLYRISQRYNLSVDQLRRYNKLDPKASIYPGQKLNVTLPK